MAEGEALDGYLERLAAINGITPASLLTLLLEERYSVRPTSAFLMYRPDPFIVGRIAALAGLQPGMVEQATLMSFDRGLPLRLEGLDCRNRHTYRDVVTQGWFPTAGSQVCCKCLALNGVWRVEWRLPIITTCAEHRSYLATECAGCGKRFRSSEHSPLRQVDDGEQRCGNSLGLRNRCRQPIVSSDSTEVLDDSHVATVKIKEAIAGERVVMLGALADPQTYLAEVRHLATLILHLASRPTALKQWDWAHALHLEAATRTTELRGPRWGISPPRSAKLRNDALSAATAILNEPHVTSAGERLAVWIELIRDVPNGPAVWLRNRTTYTQTVQHVIRAAITPRHHVGRRLDWARKANEPPQLEAIPQLIDRHMFQEFFDGMLGGYEWTGRLYVSLCLVRSGISVRSWGEAAMAIGLSAEIGIRAARAASNRMRVGSEVFADAVAQLSGALPRDRNFRRLEGQVIHLARTPNLWFPDWCLVSSPARRAGSFRHATTWMWCEVAQGLLDTSPGWSSPIGTRQKAAYRAFREGLGPGAQDRLRLLASG